MNVLSLFTDYLAVWYHNKCSLSLHDQRVSRPSNKKIFTTLFFHKIVKSMPIYNTVERSLQLWKEVIVCMDDFPGYKNKQS